MARKQPPSAGETDQAAAEYRRALRDYTQLVRHRLANPLTAIRTGLAILEDQRDTLDDVTRQRVVAEISAATKQLEHVILTPTVEGAVERSLHPVPSSEQVDVNLMAEEAWAAESRARDVNIRYIAESRRGKDVRANFLCECWSPECIEHIELDIEEYFELHRRPNDFVILPEHALPLVEHVVERRERWWIVRKLFANGNGNGNRESDPKTAKGPIS